MTRDDWGTALLCVALLIIAALLWLSTPAPGNVDPPSKPIHQDIPTCDNGLRSDCGSARV